MNPPYMGSDRFDSCLTKYAKDNYPNSRWDLYAIFMEIAIDRLCDNGKYGMINMHNWMFLSSFESLRTDLLSNYCIDSMLHLGPHTFDELGGEVVQNTAFIVSKTPATSLTENLNNEGTYFRLTGGKNCSEKEYLYKQALENHAKSLYYSNIKQNKINEIPGHSLSYWASNKYINHFTNEESLEDVLNCIQGMITGDTNKYLKKWFEVEESKLLLHAATFDKNKYWVAYTKGGTFRKWYGNNEWVLYWVNDGNYLVRNRSTNSHLYLKPCFTWWGQNICS